MRNSRHRLLLIPILACALCACGKKGAGDQMTFNIGDGTLTANAASGGVTIKSDDGTTASVDGDGPVELPPGVDVYPGAQVTRHMTIDMGPNQKSYVVAASTPATITQVLDHYRALAKAGGFRISAEQMDETSSTLSADKDGIGFSLLVKPDVPNTDFQLSAHANVK